MSGELPRAVLVCTSVRVLSLTAPSSLCPGHARFLTVCPSCARLYRAAAAILTDPPLAVGAPPKRAGLPDCLRIARQGTVTSLHAAAASSSLVTPWPCAGTRYLYCLLILHQAVGGGAEDKALVADPSQLASSESAADAARARAAARLKAR